jgi:adenylosuccinate synthase
MITETKGEISNHLQRIGHEFGTTTNRPRRCGWLDLVVVKHSCNLSGITKIALTKLDVLCGLKKIKICVAYEIDREITNVYPHDLTDSTNCKPLYREFHGWERDKKVKSFDELPQNAKDYVLFIKEYLKIPIWAISIGPERSETILI